MDLNLRVLCPTCSGGGITEAPRDENCVTCGGEGTYIPGLERPMKVREFVALLNEFDPNAWVCFSREGMLPPNPVKRAQVSATEYNNRKIVCLDITSITGLYDDGTRKN